MPRPHAPELSSFSFDRDGSLPLGLGRRLVNSLRLAVLNGQFPPGARLPSTRVLCTELGVSRNTVLDAYSQLLAEGYLEGRIGSGTFVSRALPEDSLHTARDRRGGTYPLSGPLSSRGTRIAAAHQPMSGDELRAFNPGFPRLDPSLFASWWRLMARHGRLASAETLSYGDGAGYRPLREAIASYTGAARGVRCTADRVIVTTGTQQAIALASRLLLERGDQVWMEDPGYAGARAAFTAASIDIAPIPIDDEGLLVELAIRQAPGARFAYVTPSHQYPMGVTMALGRRLRLLEWATRSDGWILEDDYDSEFRHSERPLPTLQSLDLTSRVLYIGTFSKVLFPALRLGYLIVPEDLSSSFARAQIALGGCPPTIEQAALAGFIAEGHLLRHVRLMRRRYEELRAILESEMKRHIGSSLTVKGAQIGLHVVGRLAEDLEDREVARCAAAADVEAPPLSNYFLGAPTVSGLVLGYGHLDPPAIRAGVARLAAAIAAARTARRQPGGRALHG